MANQGVGNLGFGGGSSGGTGGSISIAPINQTPSVLDISGLAGSSLATWRSMTFVIETGTCDIGGKTYQEGTYSFSNDTFGTLGAISYDATLSTDCSILITL